MNIKMLAKVSRTQLSSTAIAVLLAATVSLVPSWANEIVSAPAAVSSHVLIDRTGQTELFAHEPAQNVPLEGKVTVLEQTVTPQQTLEHLLDLADAGDEHRAELTNKANLHGKTVTKIYGRTKGMLQFATAYQGFESSSEAADVILGEKLKLKSSSAVEYVTQKRRDARHLQLTCGLMEIATGLGLSDATKRDLTVKKGLQEIIPLVGEQEANKCLQSMTEWAKGAQIPNDQLNRDAWDVLEVRQKSADALSASLKNDSVVKAIEARLHKYNRHSNFARALAKVVHTTCSVVAFSPTVASPGAQAAQFIFVACTGGPEEKKLLTEVYLDRCFASRFDRLSQESLLTVSNLNHSVLTKNAVLYACTQALMDGLTNTHTDAAATVADSARKESTAAAPAPSPAVPVPPAAMTPETASTPTTVTTEATE